MKNAPDQKKTGVVERELGPCQVAPVEIVECMRCEHRPHGLSEDGDGEDCRHVEAHTEHALVGQAHIDRVVRGRLGNDVPIAGRARKDGGRGRPPGNRRLPGAPGRLRGQPCGRGYGRT